MTEESGMKHARRVIAPSMIVYMAFAAVAIGVIMWLYTRSIA